MENNIEFVFRTIKDPDLICENTIGKNGKKICKRGDFIFFKERGKGKYYGIPIEVTQSATGENYLSVVSFFPSKRQYIEKFPIVWDKSNPEGFPTLWDREDGGIPPS